MSVTPWITTKQVVAILGVSRQWLSRHRSDGIGPRAHRRGGRVLYDRGEIEVWKEAQRT